MAESGIYASESDFETKVVEPLLRGWGQFTQQAPCRFQFGVNEHCGRIDFLVRDGRGAFTLVESKLRILNDEDLARATAQAKSYALMAGLTSFIVAAPEGFWCYSLGRNREKLLRMFTHEELSQNDAEMRELLLKARR